MPLYYRWLCSGRIRSSVCMPTWTGFCSCGTRTSCVWCSTSSLVFSSAEPTSGQHPTVLICSLHLSISRFLWNFLSLVTHNSQIVFLADWTRFRINLSFLFLLFCPVFWKKFSTIQRSARLLTKSRSRHGSLVSISLGLSNRDIAVSQSLSLNGCRISLSQ